MYAAIGCSLFGSCQNNGNSNRAVTESASENKTEEKIEIIGVCDLVLERTVSNLQWLIPMALSMNLSPCETYQITESYIAEFGR